LRQPYAELLVSTRCLGPDHKIVKYFDFNKRNGYGKLKFFILVARRSRKLKITECVCHELTQTYSAKVFVLYVS